MFCLLRRIGPANKPFPPFQMSTTVSLSDVQTAYKNSTYMPAVYALMPPKYRNVLMEDDTRIDAMINVLQNIVNGTEPNPKFKLSIKYFKNHTKDAAAFVLEKMMEMEEGCEEYGEERGPDFPVPIPPSPELLALLRNMGQPRVAAPQ